MREFVIALQKRGVELEIINSKLRCRGALNIHERETVKRNAQLIAALLQPDLTLPNEIEIPATVPNNVVAIADYINRQRKQQEAA